jgi:acetyl-CoA synthase
LTDKLKAHCEELGDSALIEKIADETAAVNSEELLAFMEKVKHPALEMEPMI